ncbi:MAG: hypothetical protein WC346_04715 [Methanogenium sp.]|jgi:hypothetical protein
MGVFQRVKELLWTIKKQEELIRNYSLYVAILEFENKQLKESKKNE